MMHPYRERAKLLRELAQAYDPESWSRAALLAEAQDLERLATTDDLTQKVSGRVSGAREH